VPPTSVCEKAKSEVVQESKVAGQGKKLKGSSVLNMSDSLWWECRPGRKPKGTNRKGDMDRASTVRKRNGRVFPVDTSNISWNIVVLMKKDSSEMKTG